MFLMIFEIIYFKASQYFISFTRQTSKRTQGSPFSLTQTSVIDLFPMTEMYETVMLLQR